MSLDKTFDLTDPATLQTACEEMAAGMEQQAMAANNRNAFQGHPQPVFFFNRAAAVLKAAGDYLRDANKPDAKKK